MADKKLKIIQWYTGEIARHQIRTVAACPSMELVGAFVHHEDKVGLLVKASTTHQGTQVATIELRFLLGKEYVRPEWLAGGPTQGWIEVDVRATPGSRLTHEIYADSDLLGTWATGTKAINAIPFVCAARPGLLSPTELPLARMLRLHP
jgi:hypothetical protein